MSVSVMCRPVGETSVSSSASGTDGTVCIEWLVAVDEGRSEVLVVIDVGVARAASDSFASDSFSAVCG